MKRHIVAYPHWFYLLLLIAILSLFASGLLLIPTQLEFKFNWEVSWRLESAQRILVVALHVGAGWILLFICGALWPIHMRAGWRKKQNRISGALKLACVAVLALSGIGLYYFGDEVLLIISSILHTFFGLALGLFFLIHILGQEET